jgi:hypothetical protein
MKLKSLFLMAANCLCKTEWACSAIGKAQGSPECFETSHEDQKDYPVNPIEY